MFWFSFLLVLSILTCQCKTEDPILFEGDMVSTPEQRSLLRPATESDNAIEVKRRIAVQSDKNLWPNGVIYYYNTFKNDPKVTKVIKDAMNHIMSRTCIRFQEIQAERQVPDYIYIHNGSGCWAYIGYNKGYNGGRSLVSLGQPVCSTPYVVIHELLHTAGLYHYHSRPDRENYLKMLVL